MASLEMARTSERGCTYRYECRLSEPDYAL
jgi:hypothetical protein